MKKTIFLAIILASLLFTSCGKWLDESSSTKITAVKLFESRDGYKDALSGVYVSMGDQRLYGAGLAFSFLDWTTYPYLKSGSTVMNFIQDHLYTNVTLKGTITSIWWQAYNSIANINMMLRSLDENGGKVLNLEAERELMRAELLGLRAFIHFDLMVLYGPADWSVPTRLMIPYVREYTSKVTPQLDCESTVGLLWADLQESLAVLEKFDPVVLKGEDAVKFESEINTDGFWSNRNLHLNYYAALALAARICQWEGKLSEAAGYAQKVIDGAFGTVVKWLDPESQVLANEDTSKDWLFRGELLFALDVTNLYDILNNSALFDLSSMKAGQVLPASLVDNTLYVRMDASGSQAGLEDLRGPAMQLRRGATGYYCYKYFLPSGYKLGSTMPMIRISEMYYILAENLIKSGKNDEALAVLDEVRRHRGVSDTFRSGTDADTELEKEYYREFIGEISLFRLLKNRKVTSSLYDGFNLTFNDLCLPYPDEELIYGRRQEL